MNYKISKILENIIVTLLYAATLLITTLIVCAGVSGLIRLVTAFNMRGALISLMVVIFFYWIIKTS